MRNLILIFFLLSFSIFCTADNGKRYWDKQVKELCEKYAGITIYEKVEISKPDYPNLKYSSKGRPILPSESTSNINDPFFIRSKKEYIHKGTPEVWKYTQSIIRRKDSKALSSYTSFSRVGGDITGGAFPPSSYSCEQTDEYILKQSSTITVKKD